MYIIPSKLDAGDEIRVLALSRSLGAALQQAGFTEDDIKFATNRLEAMGLTVSFGRHVRECNDHLTASPQHRLEDLREAIASPSVKAILAVSGGMGLTQILDGIDYDDIKSHPKIICGYSDVGHLCNAILSRAGVVAYYGPNFTSFMMRQGADYTLRNFRECLFGNSPIEIRPADQWSDDAWPKDQENRTFHEAEGFWAIQDGEAEGRIVGGSYWCLNMLQGTSYFPPLREAVLFLEHPANGKATLMELDGGLRALSFLPEFPEVRAIVIGRYAKSGGVTRENLAALFGEIPALRHLPVVANCDFGHTTPVVTVPIGGRCKLQVGKGKAFITLTDH
ncbi:MAG: S66 peptidase family protein [Verrucomicrobiia bacterium]|jgi:muramoyltetrapeptide carboxypeptidase LdcA involved in peptidoglycan recycling